jgi:hypothetical protein
MYRSYGLPRLRARNDATDRATLPARYDSVIAPARRQAGLRLRTRNDEGDVVDCFVCGLAMTRRYAPSFALSAGALAEEDEATEGKAQ